MRVSVRSVQRWRQAWSAAGRDGVRSRGPASRPKLSNALFAVLEEELSQRAARAWLAGPEMDTGQDHADQPAIAHVDDAVRDFTDAAASWVR
ncbi:hypothetical protein ACF097_33405 [Streptomyces flaveolus]|uniref:hypothetical protein n=1 Tax=Streptomyces flaveolus TaxID=67297 RepID=UPI0036FBB415